ncbi:MAG: 30S ribosomal protein S5 [Candidatus Thorarchaeota archaeon]|nr:MAG: 30S ribosomal protein S5 [Candidatus Thorarchaeota archaeon]RLI56005.1 MAG: 30S ribosomal protein S5 [Candidatus Thorarchaeota archaeon]
MSRQQRKRRTPRVEYDPLQDWVPRTNLGRLVKEGHINSLEEILYNNFRIREPEIVDILFPDLRQEVVDVTMVQRQSDSGQQKSFRVTVVVGNGEGVIGIGVGKAPEFVPAVRAAEARAKLNITIFRRGCGSWECRCGEPHSIPFEVKGRSGSVTVTLRPAPKGTGLVTADVGKIVLRIAGLKDVWSITKGRSRTSSNFAKAFVSALVQTYRMLPPQEWATPGVYE